MTETSDIAPDVAIALGRVPSGRFVLTSRHEDRQSGMLVNWVQQACFEPPMLSVAIGKGRGILPLISESRHFGLCQIGVGQRILPRKFAEDPDPAEDPFLGFDLLPGRVVPIMKHCLAWFECEVTCHMDVEGDHDLFVGTVLAAGLSADPSKVAPEVRLREDGREY